MKYNEVSVNTWKQRLEEQRDIDDAQVLVPRLAAEKAAGVIFKDPEDKVTGTGPVPHGL